MKNLNKMKIILSESQYFRVKKLIESSEDDIDNNVEPTKYTYLSVKLWEKGRTKKYFFNKVKSVEDKNPIPGKIKIVGSSGDFIFDKDKIKIQPEREVISIDKDEFDKNYKIEGSSVPSTIGINSKTILSSLKMAFPDNWMEEDEIYSAGLRGIYTIGDKIGDPLEDWSIMNYFDTKLEIHDLLYLRYKELDSNEDMSDWLVSTFRNDTEFINFLVDRQWKSIESGIKLEKQSVNNVITKLGISDVVYYPFGSKMDRWYGIDVTISGLNCQIKPMSSFYEKDGKYIINTYGMRDYKSKRKVDRIIFANKNQILIFRNSDYDVVSRSKVIFNIEPKIF